MHQDRRGLELSTASSEAARLYDETIERLFEYRLDMSAALKAVLQADPEFVLGQCLRGYALLMLNTTAVAPKVGQAIEQARAGAASERERLHLAALEAWAGGDVLRACQAWEAILLLAPHDLLALKLHHNTTFWTGRAEVLRATVAGVMDAWDESLPGYGYVLGMFAFALEECGHYAQAEAAGRRACELNPDDLWAIHALAHVYDMQGRLAEGLALFDRPANAWDDRNPFRGHLWWHHALLHLFRGEHERALELYDERVRAANTDFYLDLQNMASLLKRLEFQGVDVGERWAELVAYAEPRLDDHVLAFTDVHCAVALAAAGRVESGRRLLQSLRAFARTPHNYAAQTMEPLALPLCEAVQAFEAGDPAHALEGLLALRHALAPLGGSHEQRDLFEQYLIEAALRAGQHRLARSLLGARLALRPNHAGDWRKYAAVLRALGEDRRAQSAAERAARVH